MTVPLRPRFDGGIQTTRLFVTTHCSRDPSIVYRHNGAGVVIAMALRYWFTCQHSAMISNCAIERPPRYLLFRSTRVLRIISCWLYFIYTSAGKREYAKAPKARLRGDAI